ncbi:MAG: sigma-70 family RNA polymerase sigma factor [Saprospiraceae bacterium]|nr:sigma-70 family RNA polymerase sigma factor [Saprospiraceae bacterium]MCF8248529.1 sigma-70 family RNA polymerase sigma factor [Saprospiraceae bacterium]MCF8283066.1 sigma-70 family RNA polymerase sigma factor [Bacteroidales bacterium]MCF8439298.1 sigma-70 family RNA polymerase sigma factor [Saprospiraceae bacterium]
MDAELVSMLQSGNQEAFGKLYDNYSALVFGTIVRIVEDGREAENLLQDCFIKVWLNIGRYDVQKGRLATWMINIARNTAIDFTRSKYYSQKRKNQNLENFVGNESGKSYSQPAMETLGLRQMVEKLNPACRQVIEWMYFEGYTQQEIAENFGIPLGTVKSRTRLAIKTLRAYFEI